MGSLNKAIKKIRPKVVPLGANARCLICGIHSPLDTCHIVPQSHFHEVPAIHRKVFIDYDGINVFTLCKNHHALYDKFQLDPEDFAQIQPQVFTAILLLLKHTQTMTAQGVQLPQRYFEKTADFINKFSIYGKEEER